MIRSCVEWCTCDYVQTSNVKGISEKATNTATVRKYGQELCDQMSISYVLDCQESSGNGSLGTFLLPKLTLHIRCLSGYPINTFSEMN